MALETIGTPALWIGFLLFVLAMLALDLGVFHRRSHEVSLREAGLWSAAWVGLALLANVGIYLLSGPERALEFTAGYLIEKALAIDNLFLFTVVFSHFGVPAAQQHRVLVWGVVGALVLRGAFVFAGVTLIQLFHPIIYVFGALLIFTGVKLLIQGDREPSPEHSPLVKLVRRLIPVTAKPVGDRFTVLIGGRRHATPLLLALVVIEVSDVLFAIDSVPAVFAVTRDPFIVFTSNVFAILGLRSMYFLLAGILGRFRYLPTGIALVLVFVGLKMLFSDVFDLPIFVSLAAVLLLLAGSIALSLLVPPKGAKPAAR